MDCKRTSARVRCDLSGIVQATDQSWQHSVELIDLSATGARATAWRMDEFERLANERFIVEFTLPHAFGGRADVMVTALAQVEWMDYEALGMRFVALMPYSRKRLQLVLAALRGGE